VWLYNRIMHTEEVGNIVAMRTRSSEKELQIFDESKQALPNADHEEVCSESLEEVDGFEVLRPEPAPCEETSCAYFFADCQ